MIDIYEIRIGNYLQNTNGNIGKVRGIDMMYGPKGVPYYEVEMQYHENSTCYSSPKFLLPVPLTEAILEKSGWEFKTNIWVKKGPIRMGWRPHNKELIVGYHTLPIAVLTVHQLQNLLIDYGLTDNIVV